MNRFEKKRIEREFKLFASRHLDSPRSCKNLEQIQFYIQEISQKITHLKENFNYVPDYAYSLLDEYNQKQNKEITENFRKLYC